MRSILFPLQFYKGLVDRLHYKCSRSYYPLLPSNPNGPFRKKWLTAAAPVSYCVVIRYHGMEINTNKIARQIPTITTS